MVNTPSSQPGIQLIKKQPPKKSASNPNTTTTPRNQRQSKLAKEHSLSNSEEAEIKEVFHIFSAPHEDFPQEREGVIPREDVRKALV